MLKESQGHSFLYVQIKIVVLAVMLTPSCNGQVPSVSCPTSSSISPCSCSSYPYVQPTGIISSYGIAIDCNSKNLTDSEISVVLNYLLFSKTLSPAVYRISANFNRLSKVPVQISKFPFLFIVELGGNHITEISCNDGNAFIRNRLTNGSVHIDLAGNEITRIPSGAFNFPFAYSVDLSLQYNKNESIAQDTFLFPSAKSVQIYLMGNNKISSIPDGIFNYSAAIYDPIDCSTDPCHLAWLFLGTNSSQMLSRIKGHDVCSNRPQYEWTAPPFTALSSFSFSNNCHCSYD